MGRVTAITIAPAKGAARQSVDRAELRSNWGLEGDAYAGPGPRQVVLLAAAARDAIEAAKRPTGGGSLGYGPTGSGGERATTGLCYPRFRENILVDGLDPGTLTSGATLNIGQASLCVSEASKRCYPECTMDKRACQIRGHVAFCTVERGGAVAVGDDVAAVSA